jgi:predicted enzyme related to lactoylglutathione lyase
MSKAIMYACVYTDCEKTSILFYTELLGYVLQEDVNFGTEEHWWILRRVGQGDNGLILIKITTDNHHKNTLIINVHDCILEYCKIKEIHIKNISEPSYSPLGLSFNFYDPSGNKVVVLEERKYNDKNI